MAEISKWYVVHTYSGYENKVATNIEKIVENRKMHDLILEVKVPTEIVTEIKDEQKKEVERKIFTADDRSCRRQFVQKSKRFFPAPGYFCRKMQFEKCRYLLCFK